MLRQSFIKAARPASRLTYQTRLAFSTSPKAMAEGDTGAPLTSGGQGDAFHKREKANEDYAIREREKEKLLELKRKLSDQKEHLKKLEDDIDELTKAQGGEQN